ncbi:protoporphyrinogen oxidase [Phytoactinopolyspora limicola]|uniref:protoporphyrinogen oxidase n=1 Tax=Phytoactinopolyspora limicola TaxID=2715536 RepID=UPI0014091813|nr:protoporphyrinogen oxidase [Phytoactinopolyspora limicola]
MASGSAPARGPVRVAVVGGGISGLAAAWFLRRELGEHAEITVLEQRDVIGGHLRVSEVAGVPVDEGAESLLARRPEAVELARAAGLDADIVYPAAVGAGLWSRGALHALPAGTVMGVPADPATLSALLTADEIAAAVRRDGVPASEAFAGGTDAIRLPLDADVAIGRLVGARMGRAVADRLVEPLLGGVYAGRADQLSLDATIPALGAAARRHTSLAAAVRDVREATPATGGPAPAGGAPAPATPVPAAAAGAVFAGLRGGVGRLPAAVARAAGATVRTGVTVRGLRRVASGWELDTGPVPAPEMISADAVVLAVPTAPAARLLKEVAAGAAADLGAVETASMAIVTMALPASAFPRPPASSGFLVPPVDGHRIKAVTFSSVKWPWLAAEAADLVLVRASLGRQGESQVLQRDDADLVEVVRHELRAAVGVNGAPVDTRVTRWGGALPQYAVGHLDRVARVLDAVKQVPGLAVCGAVYAGVGVAACVATAEEAAERVAADLRSGYVRIEA